MDLNKAQQRIYLTWSTGIVINGYILYSVFDSYISGEPFAGILWPLVYLFVTSGLVFGIYKRSRICVIAMFILFVFLLARTMYNLRQEALASPELPTTWEAIVVAFIVLCITFEGIRGTFTYHKLKPIRKNENIESNTNFT